MRLALIADVHDNLINLKKCLDWCHHQNIKKILCCGDLTNLDTVQYLAHNFSGEIFIINGNGDNYLATALAPWPQIHHQGILGVCKIANIKIGLCHEPEKIKQLLATNPNINYIIYGHTHRPSYSLHNHVALINPGNLAGIIYPASFAVLDTIKPSLNLQLLINLE